MDIIELEHEFVIENANMIIKIDRNFRKTYFWNILIENKSWNYDQQTYYFDKVTFLREKTQEKNKLNNYFILENVNG